MIFVLGLVVALVLFAGPAWLSAPLGWLILGYLLTRAWPGVRADLSGLRVRGPRSLKVRRSRGAYL